MGSTVRSEEGMQRRVWARALAVLGSAALVGCEGTVTLDMQTTLADPALTGVIAEIEGVEFLSASGNQTLLFDDPQRINLLQYVDGNLFRLFTDEQLPDGRYTGVRLLFDPDDEDDDVVTTIGGLEFELNNTVGAFADVAFTLDESESTSEDLVLTLDLRQSLSFDDGANVYTLTPVLRAVLPEETGEIFGRVTANCPGSGTLVEGGAAYLFAGRDRIPDDRDGLGEEPFLTTRVLIQGGVAAVPQFFFNYIPEGDYTIALTCNANEDDPLTNDELAFGSIENIEVTAEETLSHDLI